MEKNQAPLGSGSFGDSSVISSISSPVLQEIETHGRERTDLKQAVVNALVLERLNQLGLSIS